MLSSNIQFLAGFLALCIFLDAMVVLCANPDEDVRSHRRTSRRQRRRRQRILQLMQADSPTLMFYNRFAPSPTTPSTTRPTPTQAIVQVGNLNIEEPGTNFNLTQYKFVGEKVDDSESEIDKLIDVLESLENEVEPIEPSEPSFTRPKEGQLRLVNGRTPHEGNIQIYHMGEWGSICDDEWDAVEAKIACNELGFPGAIGPTHSSQFGYSLKRIWMDNMYCYGTEKSITDCRFDGWGINDCESTEAAGVRCKEPLPPTTVPPPTTTPKPKTPIAEAHKDIEVRIRGGRVPEEGRVEALIEGQKHWGTVCGDGWGIPEAMVVCRELGLKYASSAPQTFHFSPAQEIKNGTNSVPQPVLTGVSCKGNEESLYECEHDLDNFCPGTGKLDVASVVCVENQSDLEPDIYELMSSAHLEDKQLFFLQCAMEENCLASEAYRLQKHHSDYAMQTRRLLRFTTSIANIGTADFRPFIPKSQWDWHACHQHYHSMETFAHFEIVDFNGVRVAEGHKASFCLEDNNCEGAEPKYDCENYGDQGITPGCKDIYYYNIDCQWIDVTELPLGVYTFRMAINPEYKVAEQTFENNAAICVLNYAQQFATIRNCTLARP